MTDSTDGGLHWREYTHTDERMRVRSIVTVTSVASMRLRFEDEELE